MMKLRLLTIPVVVLTIASILSIWFIVTNQTLASPQFQEQQALERATDIARQRGLRLAEKLSLTDYAIKKTTQKEWFALNGFRPGPDAAQFGLDPESPIWIVAFKGEVDWSGPGRQGGAGDQFDNITIALRADNLEHFGTVTFPQHMVLPLGLQR